MARKYKGHFHGAFLYFRRTKIKLVRFRSNHYPCFFTEEPYDQVLDYAKNVLKADGWNVDNIFGREFNIYDLNEFIE